jgi:hypothetical protein
MRLPTPSRSVKIEPGSPVPFSVGVVSLVTDPGVGLAIVAETGAVVSIVNETGEDTVGLPAVSVTVRVIVWTPSISGTIGVHTNTQSTHTGVGIQL